MFGAQLLLCIQSVAALHVPNCIDRGDYGVIVVNVYLWGIGKLRPVRY